MGGFLSGIFTGNSPGLTSAENNASGVEGFGTNLGEGDISTASNFEKDLLSGDPTKIGEILGPQLSTIQKQGQQQLQTQAEFGDRSGGTAAANQQNIDTQRANANQLISNLTQGAVSGLTGIGENEQNVGLEANQLQANEAEQLLQNEQNSLFGNVIGGAVGNLGSFLSTLGSGAIGF